MGGVHVCFFILFREHRPPHKMSQITSNILQEIAPSTSGPLRDRFLPYLNEALPRYEIVSARRVRAFLTTVAFESAYFRATKEYKAKSNTKAGRAQAKYWSTNFMGRGLIQDTHEETYRNLGMYLYRIHRGVTSDPEIFVKHPELLEEPKWAVESACVYWAQNRLNALADKENIFAIEGIVNRGSAIKEAWGEGDREALYNKLRKIIPDGFNLNPDSRSLSAESQPDILPVSQPSATQSAHDPATDTGAENAADVQDLTPPTTSTPLPPKTVELPAATGGSQTAKGLSWQLPSLTVLVTAAWTFVSQLVNDGKVDAIEVAKQTFGFLQSNYCYLAYVAIAVIAYLAIQKVLTYIPAILEFKNKANPDTHDVTFVAAT